MTLPDLIDSGDLEAREQDRAERRLFVRQLLLILLIALVVALRVWLV
ncbi:hypothetical protein Q5424_04075 [Conexibacter sp. JD483]|nr:MULTISPECIES: hypothetical protein [unclassified Conexibacter]MDO8184991.1 hypothetical protein [Conexibacter sp. CPCC 205706]MDO8198135.1 hypothetical protein [Conexibacter sp. CPCC 205762]MDR9368243.1 hypothetical protein [Conexibacter sp. JD483]